MDHAGRKSADRCQFFSSRNCSICLDSICHVFADGDNVSYFAARVGPHWNLTDEPVSNPFWRGSLLLDTFNLSTLEDSRELLFEDFSRLSSKDVENVLAQRG